MQTLRKKSSPGKYKHEPSRYMGEGVSFKAKLIGILEVADARGDRMCQDALSDLKMAIRAAGEHKQRIVINIALDGLKLRDEKTGDCLYHHPVHKISFIAQDMTDSRAFGYIFGSPDSGHRFFGIKTDKAASQVVGAMRDLFQAVFELRKKEGDSRHNMPPFGGTAFLMGTGPYVESIARQIKVNDLDWPSDISRVPNQSEVTYIPPAQSDGLDQKMIMKEGASVRENGVSGAGAASTSASCRQDAIADLLDLEFEMNNLHSPTASKEDLFGSDPFGDSFTKVPPKGSAVVSLPPPPSADGTGTRRRTAAAASTTTASSSTAASAPAAASTGGAAPPDPGSASVASKEEKHWFDQETEALFDESELTTPPPSAQGGVPSLRLEQEFMGMTAEQYNLDQFDVFTELDPLGTGRSKPYIHKKDFFQDLKNPPKKVLKDLVGENQPAEAAALFQASFEPGSKLPLNGTESASAGSASGETVLSALDPLPSNNTFPTFSDPFSEDPFDKTDPFSESNFAPSVSFSPNTVMQDPFESSAFADFSSFPSGTSPGKCSPQPTRESAAPPPAVSPVPSHTPAPASAPSPASVGAPILDPSLHGPLRVTLPPEKPAPAPVSTNSMSSSPRQRSRMKHQLHKQSSMGLVKLTSPKTGRSSGTRLSKQMTVDGFAPLGSSPTPLEDLSSLRPSASPSPPVSSGDADPHSTSRLSASSAELADIAPEPPPRPAPNAFSIKPPPLPPKKQHTTTIYKPPPRPPYQDDHPHYDHIENYESSSSPTPHEDKAPPIPVPIRRPRYDETPAPQRPRRPMASDSMVDDGYLSPSPLLPPPVKRTTVSNTGAPPVSMGPTLPTTEAPPLPTKTSLDITLSQLSKTGFSDLAATLGMSPSQLSKMTLQELTKCLETLSVQQSEVGSQSSADVFSSRDSERSSYKTLNESVDEEPSFPAEFEDNFDASSINLPKSSEPVQQKQQSLFDKYAVFRELLEQDSYENKPSESKSPRASPTEKGTVKQEEAPKSPVPIQVVTPPVGQSDPSVDRYAALREISLCDEASNKDDDEGDEFADGEDGDVEGDGDRDNDMDGYVPAENEPSDKEDSLTEVPRNDEDQDLLTLSAQHSESTESPTNDTTTVKDTLSIMETTIMEEEGYAADDTTEAISAVQELSDITIPTIIERPNEEQRNEQGPSNVIPLSPADARSICDSGSRVSEDAEPPLKEGVSPVEVWAKFDASRFEKPPSDEAASPWSSDGKEYSRGAPASWKDDSDREQVRGRRRRTNRSQTWREDEESEEGPWEENGWSDRESLYDEGPAWYPEQRRSRRRKVSPWRRSKPSREPSPWDSGERVPEDEWDAKRWTKPADDEEDDHVRSWKTRPKNRGSSWEEERRRCGSWEDVTPEYEDVRKRRPSPWSGEDRRSSRESMTWGEDERHQRRRYAERDGERDRHRGERRWRPERDEEYRRRRDPERERDWDRDRYAWPRKNASGDYDYCRPHRHYRDHSHDSPWDDEYSEQGEDSPHFQSGSRKWRWSRPGSGSTAEGRRSHESYGGTDEYEHSSRRYRDRDRPTSGSVERRSRSRDDAFNSDNEHDYWPEHARSRTERDNRYEQRSQTLQSWRSNRYRKSHRSPFEDDFTGDPKSQESSLELADGSKRSPLSSTSGTTHSVKAFRTAKKDSLSESEEARSGRGRSSCGSSHRQSPFEDDFTTSEACNSGRLMSASSDVSDHGRFGADERSLGTAGNLVAQVPRSADSGVFGSNSSMEHRNGRSIDDVFLPTDTPTPTTSVAPPPNSESPAAPLKPIETRRSVRLSGDDKNLAGMKARLSSLRRTDSSSSLRKSDSINIFARSCDPFDDDDFFNGDSNASQAKPKVDSQSVRTPGTSSTSAGDHMKWTDAFESFNFQDEQ